MTETSEAPVPAPGPPEGAELLARKAVVRVTGADAAGADPAEFYRWLHREHGPVVPVLLDGDVPAWFVIGYRELHQITADDGRFARDCRRWNAWHRVPDDWPLMPYVGWTPSVMFAEGDAHRRRAGAIGDALGAVDPPVLAGLCARECDALVTEFVGDGKADLVEQYSHRVPLRIIARLFGLAGDEIPELVRDVAESLDVGDRAARAHERIHARMRGLVEARGRCPAQDVPSVLLGHAAGLTPDEITIDLLVVMAAAQQPTGNWIANALRLILEDDQLNASVQGGRLSVDQALRRVLWDDTPTQNFIGRWAVQGCDLSGHRISAGDLMVMGLAAANRDPRARSAGGHRDAATRAYMSFGHGEHGCPYPGPRLALMIARTAIEVLLDRLPDVALAVPADELEWRPSFWMRGLHDLPVTFDPSGVGPPR
ncbi:cytochrome P450 [Actinomadura cremea]|nr:cytochrome P450 [Actinomadura cremea]